jgi:nucleotidyltransferase/DNA polymerase involved in DNA repair
MQRSIFHVRFKNFLVQAERLTDTRLRTRPIAIISSNQQTGTIISLSDEARQEDLERGMKVSLVRKMNHSVLLLPFNQRLYTSMNQYIYDIISSHSPLVEPAYYGQYYLDMTGMNQIYRSNKEAGNLILRGIQNKIQLNSALGISANKLVSSISTLAVPEPINEVDTGCESKFIAPLYSQILPVVKENFVKRIVEFVILKRVRDIQQILNHPETAAVLFGKFHRQVNLQAHGKDFSAVVPPLSKPHIIKQKILNIDTNDLTVLEAMVQMLAEQIGFELRTRKQIPHSICVEIHYSDGIRNSGKGRGNFNDDKSLTALCLNLFSKANYRRNRIRSVLVDATNLQTVSQQLDLFDERQLTYDTLSKTIDKIRARFGESSIHSASALAS